MPVRDISASFSFSAPPSVSSHLVSHTFFKAKNDFMLASSHYSCTSRPHALNNQSNQTENSICSRCRAAKYEARRRDLFTKEKCEVRDAKVEVEVAEDENEADFQENKMLKECVS